MELASNSLTLAVRETSEARLISMAGELDIAARDEVDAVLTAAAAHGAPLIIDLTALRFIDSSGIHVLVIAQRRASDDGRRLLVVRGTKPVTRVLALCGLESRVEMHDSLADAIAAAGRPSVRLPSGASSLPLAGKPDDTVSYAA